MNTAPVALVVLGLAFVAAMSAKSDVVGGGGGINGGGVKEKIGVVIALGSARRVWILWCGCGAEDGCVGGGLDSGAVETTVCSYASYTEEGAALVDRIHIAQPEEAELKCCQRCYDFVTLKLPGM